MTLFLETERLILKKTNQADFDEIFKLRSDSDVMRYAGRGVKTEEEVQKFFDTAISYQEKHGMGFCSVFEKETDDFVGQAGIFHIGFYDEQPEIEITYRLHKKYWRRGYGTELTRALIHWGFEHLPVEKLVAFVYFDNCFTSHFTKMWND